MELTKEQKKKDNFRFGGNMLAVFKRDGFACVDCGITLEQHIDKYGKKLTINHINGIGRNSKIPDNNIKNLETLCLPCHGKKDSQNRKWLLSKGNPQNR